MTDNWRPIESAPKDGTKIDVWVRERGTGRSYRVADVWWSGPDLAWAVVSVGGVTFFEREGLASATHWMPLPEGPQA